MKIAHLITTIERGGAENQLLVLVREQIKLNFEITVFPLKGNLDLQADLIDLGAMISLDLYNKSFLKLIFKINFIQLKKFNVVHCHLPLSELVMAFSSFKNVVITRHYGGKFYPKANRFFSRILSRFATFKVQKVIAISNFVKMQLIENREIQRKKKIEVVHYGFNLNNFLKCLTIDDNLEASKLCFTNFGTLARLSPEKDIPTLINAFALLRFEKSDSINLYIYGSGLEKKLLTDLIRELGLDETSILRGKTENSIEALSSLDVFVLTSTFEGFGMVLLEAMAMNLPIISSNIPTAIEVLGEDGAAVFFDQGNSIDLCEKMKNIRALLNSNYKKLQQERLNYFSSKQMSDKINLIYNSF